MFYLRLHNIISNKYLTNSRVSNTFKSKTSFTTSPLYIYMLMSMTLTFGLYSITLLITLIYFTPSGCSVIVIYFTPSGCSVIVIYFTPSGCSMIDSYCSNGYRENLVSSSVSAGLRVNDLLTQDLCTHLSGEPFLNAVEVTQSVIGAYASIHESSRSAK